MPKSWWLTTVSGDGTSSIVERWMERYPRLHLIKNPGNRGKGYAIRNGILQAAGEIVMFTDADLSAPMVEAERLMDALQAGSWTLRLGRVGLIALGRRFTNRSIGSSLGGASTG